MPSRIRAVLFDFGDTLVDEASEEKRGKVTIRADFLPGAVNALDALRATYALGLVADGRQQSYVNVLAAAGILSWFGSIVSSEVVGAEKPAPEPFLRCLAELGVPRDEFGRVVMVGNRLDRDIAGAQAVGVRSVWIHWSHRYPTVPQVGDPVPDAAIQTLFELPQVIRTMT
jgi:FMN phosphatase YigB (HAD superfamily)